MGTPEFSLPAFEKIYASHHKVVACYTQPPKPASRGMQLKKSAIHLSAEQKNIPVFTPQNFKSDDEKNILKNLNADVAVVAAYGLLLPLEVLNAPKFGCINIHPSLLPRWRGAAPIHRPIIEGDVETGCCIMKMDVGLDTGDVILQKKIPLPITATTAQMHDELANIGADMVVQVLDLIEQGASTYTKQSEVGVTYAKKILKEESKINFNLPAQNILNLIRGLNPYPAAYFEIDSVEKKIARVKIFSATAEIKKHTYICGEILNENNCIKIACADGFIIPTELQPEGKRRMSVQGFLNGYKI
jgi:methionyl-tRNA formyltransferase